MTKRGIDLLVGIVLGIVAGIVIVALFVFVWSEQAVDAPRLDDEAPIERPAEP